MPAFSATRSRLVSLSALTSISLTAKRTLPPIASSGIGANSAKNRSMCRRWLKPAASKVFSNAVMSEAGPQA